MLHILWIQKYTLKPVWLFHTFTSELFFFQVTSDCILKKSINKLPKLYKGIIILKSASKLQRRDFQIMHATAFTHATVDATVDANTWALNAKFLNQNRMCMYIARNFL